MTTVAAAIIRRNPHILISRRLTNVHLPGLWEFPGGKVELGETLSSALQREIREELGIEIEVFAELLVTTHHYPTKSVELHFFDCAVVSGEPRAIEVAEFKWVEPTELHLYDFPEADREIVARLMKP
jgi:mutator protein MutT